MKTETDLEVVVPVIVTGRMISDLLISAFEGGSNYWIRSVWLFDDDRRVSSYGDHPVQNLSSITVIEDDSGKKRTILMRCTDDLKKGLKIMAEKYTNHFANLINDNADAETGDVFLQCCLFGEIVYG